MRILIVYATTHGQTARIADRLALRMRERGVEVTNAEIRSLPKTLDLSCFDGVIVGGYVHGNQYARRLRRFVRMHRAELTAAPSAFFSVSLLQLAKSEAKRTETMLLPSKRLAELGWKPDLTEVIAGALPWTRFGFFGRWLMKRIWAQEFEIADVSKDEIYTDWSQVDRFADGFLQIVQPLFTDSRERDLTPA